MPYTKQAGVCDYCECEGTVLAVPISRDEVEFRCPDCHRRLRRRLPLRTPAETAVASLLRVTYATGKLAGAAAVQAGTAWDLLAEAPYGRLRVDAAVCFHRELHTGAYVVLPDFLDRWPDTVRRYIAGFRAGVGAAMQPAVG